MTIVIGVTALVAAGVAVWTDLQWRRVPNWLTLPLLLLAFIYAIPGGWNAIGSVALASAILLALGIVIHKFGWFGGGDLKLLIGLGALLGFPRCAELVLYTAIAGGIMGCMVALSGGRGNQLVVQLQSALTSAIATGGHVAPVAETPIDRHFPYALAIATGLIVTLLSLTYLPFLRLPL